MNSGNAEKSLDRLIHEMKPVLRGGTDVFCVLPAGMDVPTAAIAVFREEEATTLVLERRDAEGHRLDPLYEAAWITLTVHSDLDAVGFLARISGALAAAGISCNVFSAIYHDHLFVPAGRAEDAMKVLLSLSSGNSIQ